MTNTELVPVNKYSNKILLLGFLSRINIEYPLLCKDIVAKKLANVGNKIPENLYIRVDSAYRTPRTQQILWNTRGKTIKGLVSNPNEKESPHCTGGAIDVSFIENGKEINLSDPFDKYYIEPQLKSAKITKKAQKLRDLMNKVMLEEGFAPNPREYWHFSYGDYMWAKYTGKKQIYMEMNLDKKLYYSTVKQFLYKVIKRIYIVFLNLFKIKTAY